MGFGGNSNGSFSLPDHLHTDTLLDGGSLEELVTLVDGATLAAWVAAKIAAADQPKMVVLDTDILTGAASSIELTTASKSFDDYSKFIMECDFELSGVSGVGVQINGLTSSIYGGIGTFYLNAPTANLHQTSGAAHYELCDTSTRLATGRSGSCTIEVHAGDTNGTTPAEMKTWISQMRDLYWGFGTGGTGTTSITDFTGLKLLTTGTSINFETDTRAVLYGVKR
jgi:hypothetical protein